MHIRVVVHVDDVRLCLLTATNNGLFFNSRQCMSSRATVEWYSHDKSEELEETSVPAPLCTYKCIRIRLTYRVCRFKTVRGQWNSRAMKVRSTTSIGEEVNPSAPRRKILRHVKNPCEVWQRYFSGKKSRIFFAFSLLCYQVTLLILAFSHMSVTITLRP
jgi:hypothetical protein